ncbi:hypothetical protein ml_390 [Mollivirus sibericum]|uniref:hypothetical protein n=1 Tax=Mollivirus sibericum TaxID=1678078 RepID=UPI0006B2EEEF|nr:hypothetical protein ml_390 [Mollivirus sibericum]ALD62192.1 hypothetical protein ml_390 [Mollivirus sibericum]
MELGHDASEQQTYPDMDYLVGVYDGEGGLNATEFDCTLMDLPAEAILEHQHQQQQSEPEVVPPAPLPPPPSLSKVYVPIMPNPMPPTQVHYLGQQHQQQQQQHLYAPSCAVPQPAVYNGTTGPVSDDSSNSNSNAEGFYPQLEQADLTGIDTDPTFDWINSNEVLAMLGQVEAHPEQPLPPPPPLSHPYHVEQHTFDPSQIYYPHQQQQFYPPHLQPHLIPTAAAGAFVPQSYGPNGVPYFHQPFVPSIQGQAVAASSQVPTSTKEPRKRKRNKSKSRHSNSSSTKKTKKAARGDGEVKADKKRKKSKGKGKRESKKRSSSSSSSSSKRSTKSQTDRPTKEPKKRGRPRTIPDVHTVHRSVGTDEFTVLMPAPVPPASQHVDDAVLPVLSLQDLAVDASSSSTSVSAAAMAATVQTPSEPMMADDELLGLLDTMALGAVAATPHYDVAEMKKPVSEPSNAFGSGDVSAAAALQGCNIVHLWGGDFYADTSRLGAEVRDASLRVTGDFDLEGAFLPSARDSRLFALESQLARRSTIGIREDPVAVNTIKAMKVPSLAKTKGGLLRLPNLPCPPVLDGLPLKPVRWRMRVKNDSRPPAANIDKPPDMHMAQMIACTRDRVMLLIMDRDKKYVWASAKPNKSQAAASNNILNLIRSDIIMESLLPEYTPRETNVIHTRPGSDDPFVYHYVPPTPRCEYIITYPEEINSATSPDDVDVRCHKRYFLSVQSCYDNSKDTKDDDNDRGEIDDVTIPFEIEHPNMSSMVYDIVRLLCSHGFHRDGLVVFFDRTPLSHFLAQCVPTPPDQLIDHPDCLDPLAWIDHHVDANMVNAAGEPRLDITKISLRMRCRPRALLYARKIMETNGYRWRDEATRLHGLEIFYKKAKDLATDCRALALAADLSVSGAGKELYNSYMPPFSTHILNTLINERQCKDWDPNWMASIRSKLYTQPPALTQEQWEALFDAYYWTHLAPPSERKDYSPILNFFAALGIEVRPKCPNQPTGKSRLRNLAVALKSGANSDEPGATKKGNRKTASTGKAQKKPRDLNDFNGQRYWSVSGVTLTKEQSAAAANATVPVKPRRQRQPVLMTTPRQLLTSSSCDVELGAADLSSLEDVSRAVESYDNQSDDPTSAAAATTTGTQVAPTPCFVSSSIKMPIQTQIAIAKMAPLDITECITQHDKEHAPPTPTSRQSRNKSILHAIGSNEPTQQRSKRGRTSNTATPIYVPTPSPPRPAPSPSKTSLSSSSQTARRRIRPAPVEASVDSADVPSSPGRRASSDMGPPTPLSPVPRSTSAKRRIISRPSSALDVI